MEHPIMFAHGYKYHISLLFSVDENSDEATGDMLTEEISKTGQALDDANPGFDPAPTNLSTEALNGTNITYDESPMDMKTKKNVSKLTVVVDPRGMFCSFF